MEQELVSVLIPCFDHENYIQGTIKSIIDQTYDNLELIIIDDGSKDKSFQKIQQMKALCEKRFKRVIFKTKKNEGICTTENQLFALAKGEYVYLIASDDLAKPNAIERLMSEAKKTNAVLTVGDNEIIDSNSQKVAWDKKQNIVPFEKGFKTVWQFLTHLRPELKKATYGTYESLLKGNYITNGLLFKTQAFTLTGGYVNDAPTEDWYINMQLAKIGRICFVNEVLFSYRWHATNTIKQKEKMKKAKLQTIKYEGQQVLKSNDKELIASFYRGARNIKHIVRIFGILSLYKEKLFDEKKLILKIVNRKFILRSYK